MHIHSSKSEFLYLHRVIRLSQANLSWFNFVNMDGVGEIDSLHQRVLYQTDIV
jgi:hypothetical protein